MMLVRAHGNFFAARPVDASVIGRLDKDFLTLTTPERDIRRGDAAIGEDAGMWASADAGYRSWPKLPDPVVYAVPAFILLLIAEMLISLRARQEPLRGARHADLADARDGEPGCGRARRRGGDRHVGVRVPDTACSTSGSNSKLVVGVDSLLLPRRPRLLRLPSRRAPRALVLGKPCHPPQLAAL